MGFDDFTKRDVGNVTLKKRDPGSPVSRMYNENLVVTVKMPEIHLRREMNFTNG